MHTAMWIGDPHPEKRRWSRFWQPCSGPRPRDESVWGQEVEYESMHGLERKHHGKCVYIPPPTQNAAQHSDAGKTNHSGRLAIQVLNDQDTLAN